MNITAETLTIFAFLIPGFISSLILNAVVVRKDKDNFSKLIEALVFSFLIYVVVSPFTTHSPVLLDSIRIDKAAIYPLQYNWRVAVPTVILSILLPLFLGFLITKDLHMKLLRRLRVTNKTARDTVWLDVFTDQKRYLIVNLSDGRRVFGWPMYFSNTPEKKNIYLYNPSWITEDGDYIDLDIHGLFLVKADNIDSIEFLNITKENAEPVE